MIIDFIDKIIKMHNKTTLKNPKKLTFVELQELFLLKKHKSINEFNRYMSYKYGDLYRVFGKTYITANPDFVEQILKTKSENYIRKGIVWNKLKQLLGNNSFTITGEAWTERRKIITKSYTTKYLNIYVDQVIKRMLPDISERLTAASKNKQTINIFYEIFRVTNSAIFEFLLNHKQEEKNLNRSFYWFKKLNQNFMSINKYIPSIKNIIFFIIKRSFLNSIKKMLIDGKSKFKSYKDLSDILSENIIDKNEKKKLYYIIEELQGELIAGMTTTTAAIGWAIYHIYKDKRILNKLRDELNRVIDGEIKLEDLDKLEYCRAIANESLRLYPPVGIFSRYAVKEDNFGEYKIKKNATVEIDVYSLHRNPKYWDNPEEFYPERFIQTKLKHNLAFIPFSYGKHICVGNRLAIMQMILTISTIVNKFDLEILNRDFTPKTFIVTAPPMNFSVIVSERPMLST